MNLHNNNRIWRKGGQLAGSVSIHGAVTTLLYFFMISVSCNKQDVQSIWMADTVVVDGKTNEWNSLYTVSNDRKCAIALMNDIQTLCFAIVLNDHAVIEAVRHNGFTFWFNHNELKEQRGIRFHVEKRVPFLPGEKNRDFDKEHNEPLKERGIAVTNIELLGTPYEQVKQMDTAEASLSGIHSSFGGGNETMVLECALPLHSTSAECFSLGMEKDSIFTITMESVAANPPPRGGPPSNGGGGPPDFSNGGPPGGGGSPGSHAPSFQGGGMGGPPDHNGTGGGGPPDGRRDIMNSATKMEMKFRVALAHN